MIENLFECSLVCGDVKGNFKTLFNKLDNINSKSGPFEFLLCVGDFFGSDNGKLEAYKNGNLKSMWYLNEFVVQLNKYSLFQLPSQHTFSAQVVRNTSVSMRIWRMVKYAQISRIWVVVVCTRYRRALKSHMSRVWKRPMPVKRTNGRSMKPISMRWLHRVWPVMLQRVTIVALIFS